MHDAVIKLYPHYEIYEIFVWNLVITCVCPFYGSKSHDAENLIYNEAYVSYVYSLAKNKMASNGEPVLKSDQESRKARSFSLKSK